MDFRLLYPGFHKKAVTFSYDDGIIEDRKLIEIFNRYHFKATFNLNFGQSGEAKFRTDIFGKEVDCSHLDLKENVSLYDGHEIANHTFHHPHLEDTPKDIQRNEYLDNQRELEKLFKRRVVGSAYPYGSYDQDTLDILKEIHVEYARTTRSTYSFHLPYDWLLWNPSIHHRDPRMMEILDKFEKDDEELSLLYIWGHAYEFEIDHDFMKMDEICKKLAMDKDVICLTNEEVYRYVHAAGSVYYRYEAFHNPSDEDVCLLCQGKEMLVKKKGVYPYAGK